MDLLALGNSAANFLLYCIMSTQVPCHTYHHSSHSCLRGQFRKTIRKMLGIKKRTSTSTSVTVTTKLEVKYLFDSANRSDVVVVCEFQQGHKTRGLNISDSRTRFQGHIKNLKGRWGEDKEKADILSFDLYICILKGFLFAVQSGASSRAKELISLY